MCHVVYGGAPAVMGLLALFVADVVLNFENIAFPVLRILGVLIAVAVFVVAAVLDGLPSALSTLGGFLTAIFPVLLVLPHLRSERFEWWLVYVAVFTTLGFLLALPLYVYLVRLPGLVC
jgi:hypothetical protein